MRRSRLLHENEAAVEFVPHLITQPLNFRELFGREAPLQVDLGCGDGTFLTALAAANPKQNFLGIERLPGRLRGVCRKAVMLRLPNVRVLRIDTGYAVAHLLPLASTSAFHLLFPDPWPKRRHHHRRTVSLDFVARLHRALVTNGLLHIATDHAGYFQQIKCAMGDLFENADQSPTFPPTTFEKQFAVAGAPIHRLLLRKRS